jgi:hypothetical protein
MLPFRSRSRRIGIPVLLVSVLSVFSCSSDKIHRTDLHSWQRRDLPGEGIVLDIPAGAFKLQMHYISNGIADATWMISVSVDRKSAISFANPSLPSPHNRLSSDTEYMEWLKWLNTYHGDISVREMDGQSRQYRRDVRLSNGDIVSIHATYRYARFSDAERAADDAAIRRILNSARPIG